MIDQFLRPWLIGQAVQNPKLFLVCSVLGRPALYGLIGLFVGPVIVSLSMTTIQIDREEYHYTDTALLAGLALRPRTLARPTCLAQPSTSLFKRNGDGNPAHHIVELKVPFRAEPMTVVAVDTGL